MNERERFESWAKGKSFGTVGIRQLAEEAWQAGRADAMAWRPIESAPKLSYPSDNGALSKKVLKALRKRVPQGTMVVTDSLLA